MKLELKTNQEPKLQPMRVQMIPTKNGLILKRGRVEFKVEGGRAVEVVQAILSHAANGLGRDAICDQFAAPDRGQVERLVRQLESRRILMPAETAAPTSEGSFEPNMDVFYWHFGLQAGQVNKRLNERQIAIMGVNTISRQLATTLAAAGMENVTIVDYPLLTNLRLYDEEGELLPNEWSAALGTPVPYKEWITALEPSDLDCLVATSDFGGLQLMRQWNEFCVHNNCHFLPIVLQDLIGYIGPLIVPGETACFECLRARQNSNMEDPENQRAAESMAFETQSVIGFHPAMASILGDIAALELTRFYGGWMQSRLGGNLIEVNLIAMQMDTRRVLRVPRCRVCGTLNVHGTVSPNKYAFMPGHEGSE